MSSGGGPDDIRPLKTFSRGMVEQGFLPAHRVDPLEPMKNDRREFVS